MDYSENYLCIIVSADQAVCHDIAARSNSSPDGWLGAAISYGSRHAQEENITDFEQFSL